MTSRSTSQARQQPTCEPKNQDVTAGSKLGKSSGGSFPRGSKRREPNNGSLSGLNPNRPGPKSRGGAAGKRPPPRGGFSKYNPQNYEQMNLDDEFELGSVFNPGTKKQNFNHLLNFQYSPRGPAPNNSRGRNNRGPRGQLSKHCNPPTRKTYTKSHYLQANCQFIVKSSGDYSIHTADPDTLVDWSQIEQVHLKTSGTDLTSCPICLFPPTAAKISRCGHVFCWPCILHYLALSDDSYRKCPICDQDIEKADLRSVVAVPQATLITGSNIEMKLMKRERNSLFAVPASADFLDDFPVVNKPGLDRSFVKLLKATSVQVKDNILARERRELEKQWEEEKDQPEACFIQEALTLLTSREVEAVVTSDNDAPLAPVAEKKLDDLPEVQSLKISCGTKAVDPFDEGNENLDDLITLDDETTKNISQQPRPRNMSGSSDCSEGDTEECTDAGVTAADLDISTVQQPTTTGPQEPRQVFYFYQSSDGQPIFLHALNVQMLVKEFGSLENCPHTIQAEILEKESTVMTEELRDRLRYLRHLPVASSFDVAELEITALVSKSTLQCFKDQVDVRRRRRTRKLKDERRREKKIQHEQDRLLGFPGSMIRVESDYYSSRSCRNNSESDHSQSEQFPAWGGSQDDLAQATGVEGGSISFAKIAKAKPPAPKPCATLPRSSSFPAWTNLGSVKPLSARTIPTQQHQDSDGEPEPEGYVPPPERASLGDTLAAALHAAGGGGGGGGSGKKGKKGRGKPILLTGGAPRPKL